VLDEQSSTPSASVVGKGVVWVKDDAPNILNFQDDTGVQWRLNATVQTVYNQSTSPEMVLDSTRGGFTIRDNSTPIGSNLLEVQNNAGTTTFFKVDQTGATIDGKLTVTGLIDPTGMILDEQSVTPSAPAASKGVLWVKDDTPNVLLFQDDAGNSFDLTKFTGNSDTPSSYSGFGNGILVVNSGATGVDFTNNSVGTNTDATGTSVAFGGSSTVGGNVDAIALGSGATVTNTRGIAVGKDANNDISDTAVTNAIHMVHNTSATGILSDTAWVSSQVVIGTVIIDLKSTGTTTINLPSNIMALVNQIDIIKLNVTTTPTAATLDFGKTGTNNFFIDNLSFGSASENTVGARTINTALLNADGVTSLTVEVTVAGTGTGIHTARVFFLGYVVRDE